MQTKYISITLYSEIFIFVILFGTDNIDYNIYPKLAQIFQSLTTYLHNLKNMRYKLTIRQCFMTSFAFLVTIRIYFYFMLFWLLKSLFLWNFQKQNLSKYIKNIISYFCIKNTFINKLLLPCLDNISSQQLHYINRKTLLDNAPSHFYWRCFLIWFKTPFSYQCNDFTKKIVSDLIVKLAVTRIQPYCVRKNQRNVTNSN